MGASKVIFRRWPDGDTTAVFVDGPGCPAAVISEAISAYQDAGLRLMGIHTDLLMTRTYQIKPKHFDEEIHALVNALLGAGYNVYAVGAEHDLYLNTGRRFLCAELTERAKR